MTAIRYELFRLRSIRSTTILAACLVLAGPVAGALQRNADLSSSAGLHQVIGLISQLMMIVASVIPAQAIGQEYRFGLIRQTLTLFPKRTGILAAKWLVSSTIATLASICSCLLALVAAAIVSGSAVDYGSAATMLLRLALYLFVYFTIVFAVTVLTRQTALGVILPLLFTLFIEGGLLETLLKIPAEFLPFGSGGEFRVAETGAWSQLAVFAGYAVLAYVVGLVVFRSRDA